MDLKDMAGKLGGMAEHGGDKIEDAAETLRDTVVGLVPDSVKEQAEALGDKAASIAAGLIGKAADKLSEK